MVKKLKLPLTEDAAMDLQVGDMVLLSGQIVTGRDRMHKFLVNEKPDTRDIPFDLEGGVIYHCGPVIVKADNCSYSILAAGPTTSMRVEMYESQVIERYGIKGIIGKGGMGPRTLAALKENGAVYFNTISGAAAYLADRIKGVIGGWKVDEFGEPEAMWLLEIEDFPAIVTMDAHGNSLHREIEAASLENLKRMAQ